MNPQCLSAESIVYSFGAGTDISFDLGMNQNFGCPVHVFDPTPRSIVWIAEQALPPKVKFHAYGIGDRDGEISFYAPRRASSSHFSPVKRYTDTTDGEMVSAPVLRLSSILKQLGHTRIDVMKMDIEGGEYDVIADFVGSDIEVDQLLLEFHHAYATIPLQKTLDAVQNLRGIGFALFYLSPRTYEMSFIHQRVTA